MNELNIRFFIGDVDCSLWVTSMGDVTMIVVVNLVTGGVLAKRVCDAPMTDTPLSELAAVVGAAKSALYVFE